MNCGKGVSEDVPFMNVAVVWKSLVNKVWIILSPEDTALKETSSIK